MIFVVKLAYKGFKIWSEDGNFMKLLSVEMWYLNYANIAKGSDLYHL